MQTVIRLKRSLEESPSDTLILNCNKKQKLEIGAEAAESLSTVLKFSGTQDSQDYDVSNIRNSIKDGIKEQVLQKHKRNIDLTKKLSEEMKEHSKAERFKIVNCLRSISKEESDNSVTVLDIERENETENSGSNQNYVYDLYYTDARIIGAIDDYDISIHQSSAIFDSNDVYVDSDHDSEDSNAENYYTNDYPDESDEHSIDEDDMIDAMKRCDLDDLSSPDQSYAHYGDSEEDDDFVGSSYRDFLKRASEMKLTEGSASDESEENFDEYD